MALLVRLWSLRDERPAFVAASLALLAFLLAYPFVDFWLRLRGIAPSFVFWDFGAYSGAVERWQAGDPLYLTGEDGGYHGTFLYPPVAVLVFWPFVALFARSALAWVVFSTGLLWVSLQLVVGRLGVDLEWYERAGLLWVLLGFQPLLLGLKLGQTAAFLAALLGLAFVALDRAERGTGALHATSGGLTALVGVVKLSYAPVGAHLLGDRDRFAGAVATGGLVALASVFLFGAGANLAYVDVLAWGVGQGSGARSPALWLPPYYRPLFWVPGSLAVRVGASLAVAAGALLAPRSAYREVFALGLVAFPLLAPLTYTYYFVALLPAVPVLLAVELRRGGRPVLPLAGLWLVAVHSYGLKLVVDVLPAALPATTALRPLYPVLQPGLWGNALLVGLAAARVAGSVDLRARLAGYRSRVSP